MHQSIIRDAPLSQAPIPMRHSSKNFPENSWNAPAKNFHAKFSGRTTACRYLITIL
jgi:hypothetical protein